MPESKLPYDPANLAASLPEGDPSSLVAIPTDPEVMAEQPKEPKAYGRQNWANKPETVARFLATARAHFQNFDNQPARVKMLTRMDAADKFYRLATDQDKQTLNKTGDDVDTIPHVFHTVVKIATANMNDILFGQRDLPMKYIPLRNLPLLAMPEAQQVCDDRNVQLEYTMAEDDRIEKLKQTTHYLNKYGNRIVGMDWFEEEKETTERVPDPSRLGKFKKVALTTTSSHPAYHDYDMEDFWFDLQINDFGMEMENQQCVIQRFYPLYQELHAEQESGKMVNVEQINKTHLYQAASPSTAKSDRQANAGETGDTERPNGLLMGQNIWLRAPINKEGDWDEEGTIATWHWATFAGDINGGGGSIAPVCTRLIANPNKDARLPYKLIHAYPDDKGAIHLGLVDIIEPAWNEYKTTLDQWFYNKNMVSNAPCKMEEGAVINADKGFGPRRLLVMRAGKFDKLERFRIESNTNDMQAFLNYLETKIYVDLAGLTRAFRGEEMGSRTSALEAGNALSQSAKPAMETIRYIAGQLLPWVAHKDAMLMEQFADTDKVVGLAMGTPSREIKPANIYGDFRVKVTAIDTYVSTMMARQEQDRFMQVNMPLAAPDMGKRGRIAMWKWVCETRGFPVEDMFPMVSETDARHLAGSENVGFLNGVVDIPQPGENDDIHIQEHQSAEALLKTLPKDDPARIRAEPLIRQHIVLHEQQKAKEESAIAGAAQGATQKAQGMGTGETPPQNEGELAGQMLGAEGGMEAGQR